MTTRDIAFGVYRHYKEKFPEVKHYYGIIANYALTVLAAATGKDSQEAILLNEVLSTFPDKVEHPYYNFHSYRICGIARARAVFEGIFEDSLLREYADELMTAQRSSEGIVSHPKEGDGEKVWIDVATAVTPFLLFAGLHFKNESYVDEAVRQTLLMFKLLLDKECGLIHQSRGFVGEGIISGDHWSRGNGWGALPLAELCAHLPKEHSDYAECKRLFTDFARALLKYQDESGMWRQEISLKSQNGAESFIESSGTGLILYAIGTGIQCGALLREEFLPAFTSGISALAKHCVGKDFETYNSCPGCLSPGDGSIYAYLTHTKPYTDEPHGAGPIALAFARAYSMGIEEVSL